MLNTLRRWLRGRKTTNPAPTTPESVGTPQSPADQELIENVRDRLMLMGTLQQSSGTQIRSIPGAVVKFFELAGQVRPTVYDARDDRPIGTITAEGQIVYLQPRPQAQPRPPVEPAATEIAAVVHLLNFGGHYYTIRRFVPDASRFGARIIEANYGDGVLVLRVNDDGEDIHLTGFAQCELKAGGTIQVFASAEDDRPTLELIADHQDEAYAAELSATNARLGRADHIWPDGLEGA